MSHWVKIKVEDFNWKMRVQIEIGSKLRAQKYSPKQNYIWQE